MAATLEEIRVKNRQLAESNLNKQAAINEVGGGGAQQASGLGCEGASVGCKAGV
jgi:hypothetical protein